MVFKIYILLCQIIAIQAKYEPRWASLDSRPLPDWYDDAKIGIFMHFGAYTVPSYVNEWFWFMWRNKDHYGHEEISKYMKEHYPPGFSYQDFGSQMKMEFFNATRFSHMVAASGAKYLVFTSKHHDGWANWNSSYNYGWNSVDIGPHRDVLAELKNAFQTFHPDLHFGLYYSLYEWYHPAYLKDKESNFTQRHFVLDKMMPELKELVNMFHPDVIWADGDWETDENYWDSKEFLTWLYNESPSKNTVVTNDRWGRGTGLKHGDFFSGPDRFSPGYLLPHKWENAMTLDESSWGFRREMTIENVLTIEELLGTVISTVSCGGNILINVGPTRDGTIAPIFEERLLQMGGWLRANGKAIYATMPWVHQNDTSNEKVWYTMSKKTGDVFALAMGWPENDVLTLGAIKPTSETKARMIGMSEETGFLKVAPFASGLAIAMPSMSQLLRECQWCQWVYVIKLTGLQSTTYGEVDSGENDVGDLKTRNLLKYDHPIQSASIALKDQEMPSSAKQNKLYFRAWNLSMISALVLALAFLAVKCFRRKRKQTLINRIVRFKI